MGLKNRFISFPTFILMLASGVWYVVSMFFSTPEKFMHFLLFKMIYYIFFMVTIAMMNKRGYILMQIFIHFLISSVISEVIIGFCSEYILYHWVIAAGSATGISALIAWFAPVEYKPVIKFKKIRPSRWNVFIRILVPVLLFVLVVYLSPQLTEFIMDVPCIGCVMNGGSA